MTCIFARIIPVDAEEMIYIISYNMLYKNIL